MTALVLRGDARALPLPNASVDLVVTSPPYFALRSYTDGGEHYAGQIGSEATPAAYIGALLDCTREWVRVLKPSGSMWINLGDKYGGGGNGPQGATGLRADRKQAATYGGLSVRAGRDKSLMGLPWRYALGCIDELGLILRAEIVWSKPNGLPESVTDRVRRSHEQWFAFQQSGSEIVEFGAETFPVCPLCQRPVDARASLVARLHELETSVETGDLPNHEGPHQRVEPQARGGAHHDGAVGSRGASVPLFVADDAGIAEDLAHLGQDGVVSVVDGQPQVRRSGAPVAEMDAALSVDDSGEPGEFCECGRHPLILGDEPWIPQSLAAEVVQMVADGEVDAQQAADFLAGNYARTHSTWFHLVKQPRYFAAVDEIREAHAEPNGRPSYGRERAPVPGGNRGLHVGRMDHAAHRDMGQSPLGKLPGSVWNIPSEPLTVPEHLGVDHFAAFPTEWPRRIILGWSPSGICTACGEGRRPTTAVTHETLRTRNSTRKPHKLDATGAGGLLSQTGPSASHPVTRVQVSIAGYVCGCAEPTAPTTPSVVVDPFGGTGTVALAADTLGRTGISIDMSADYNRLAQWRTSDPGQRAKVLGVPKPPVELDGQDSLFNLEAAS